LWPLPRASRPRSQRRAMVSAGCHQFHAGGGKADRSLPSPPYLRSHHPQREESRRGAA